MKVKLDMHSQGCRIVGGIPLSKCISAKRNFADILAALAVALVCSLTGCASSSSSFGTDQAERRVDNFVRTFHPGYGTISAKELKPEYQVTLSKPVQTSDLAKLARPFDSETRIQSGDLLEISCSDLIEESRRETFPVHVAEDGTINVPLISERLPVGSLTAGEAEQVLRTAYAGSRLIRKPQVTLRTVEHKTHTIYVIGAVKKPGVYELQTDECDPLRAIAAAEGITDDAVGVIEVRRAAKRTMAKPNGTSPPRELNLASATNVVKADGEDDIIRFDLKSKELVNPNQLLLQNGDIVSVEQKKMRPIYVSGSVNKPGEFSMPTDREIRALEAVGLAGGVLNLSEPTKALITRRPKDKDTVVIHIDLDKAAKTPEENIRLMEGDIVSVVEDAGSRGRRAFRTFISLGLGIPVNFGF